MNDATHEVTDLLAAWSDGDQTALDKLMPLVYAELRRIAHRYMNRENPGHTLQTTALIHEAYLRLVNQPDAHWQNRAHFFAVAAGVMRHILTDFARARQFAKRGGAVHNVSLDEASVVSPERLAEVVALDDALQSLAAIDLRKSQIVELRYFGGLSVDETAEILKVSPRTVMREWVSAKAWLYRELVPREE
jgi:RNA polymerase sigma factor (TIGR02999 family)